MAFNPTYAPVGDNRIDAWGATEVAQDWTISFATGDTYVAGGLALTAGLFGLSRPIADVTVVGANTAAIVWNWSWNTQTSKLMMLATSAGVAGTAPFEDNPNATSLTGMVITVRVVTQR